MLNIIYKGKKICPAAIKHLVRCPFPGISPGSRRKPALAQDFPIQSDHEHTRWASSPFSICSTAKKKREPNNLCCSSSKRGCPEQGALAGGPSCPSTGSQAGRSTAQRLSWPIWTLQFLLPGWRVGSRENGGLTWHLFLDYCPSCSPGVADIKALNWQHKGSIWIASPVAPESRLVDLWPIQIYSLKH